MLRFIVRRILQMILVIVVLSFLLFVWLRSLPGGMATAMLGDRATAESIARFEELFGLNEPLWVQYWRFTERAVQGEFGASTSVLAGRDALDVFLTRFPATIELSFCAILLAVALGIPLGYLAAKRRATLFDNASVIASLVGVAVPVFFLAFLLKYFFAVKLGWLPVSGRQDAGIDATHVTGFFILDGILTREWDAVWNALKHLILPSLALATIPFAIIFRITRASVLDVLEEDYIRTAESKGLTNRVIRGRHVLRNALLPVVTITGLQVGALLGGAVLTERVFSFPGIGEALALAFTRKDFAVLQVILLAAAVIYVTVNLIVDILYAVIDPRVRTR